MLKGKWLLKSDSSFVSYVGPSLDEIQESEVFNFMSAAIKEIAEVYDHNLLIERKYPEEIHYISSIIRDKSSDTEPWGPEIFSQIEKWKTCWLRIIANAKRDTDEFSKTLTEGGK